MMSRVIIYSTSRCPVCEQTKALLKKWNIGFDEVLLDNDPARQREFMKLTNGARTVPQLAVDGHWIGGFHELTELHMDGELDELMEP
jgi:glutaredoxin 3